MTRQRQTWEERVANQLRQMVPGTLGGRVRSAMPVHPALGTLAVHRVPEEPATGGGKPYASVVVAASDSTAADAASADYVCDGTDDETQINAAIASLTVGGRVLLLEGAFALGAGAYVNISTPNVEVLGMGPGTVIDGALASVAGVLLGASHTRLADLTIAGTSGFAPGVGSFAGGLEHLCVERVTIDAPAGNGVYVLAAESFAIRDCTILAPGIRGIVLVGDGIGGYAERGTVSGNRVYDATEEGIYLSTARDNIVTENHVWRSGTGEASSYDGIYLLGDSDRNMIIGNKVRRDGVATRYGVNVSVAACNNNVVAGNALLDSGATGSFNDAGTATVTLGGNQV